MQSSKWVTLIFGALCLMAVAGVLNAQNLYYMAAILLTLPGVSYLFGWNSLRGLRFERELPQTAWEDETGVITYRVHNPTRIPRFFFPCRNCSPTGWSLRKIMNRCSISGRSRPQRSCNRVRFLRRGVLQIKGFEASAMDPLGVFAFGRVVACPGELIVYPRPLPLSEAVLDGAERYGWQNALSSLLRGKRH